MGYTEIIANVNQLSEKERRELVAYIVQLDESKDESYIERITREVDAADDFVRWDDVKSEFAESFFV